MRKPNAITVVLHWITAGSILVALAGGFLAVYGLADRGPAFLTHAYAGLLVLANALPRLFLRVLFPWPHESGKTPRVVAFTVRASHWIFYGLGITIPLTGWIVASSMSCCMGVPALPDVNLLGAGLKGVSPADVGAAYNLHVSLIWLLLGLVLVHVLAALFHHFILRDATLVRMLPGPIETKAPRQVDRIDGDTNLNR